MKDTKATETENLKETLTSAAEKNFEIAKSFVENGAKQFENTMNSGKAIFENITKQYSGEGTTFKQHADFMKDSMENSITAATKWFKESSKTMTDMYSKQVRFMLNSYSDFMNTANENMNKAMNVEFGGTTFRAQVDQFIKSIENSSAVLKKQFDGIIDTISDGANKDFVKEMSDLMQDTYKKQTEQLNKFNSNLFNSDALQGAMNWSKEISEKIQKDIETNFETSKKVIESIADSYKKSNFSIESGKKTLDDTFAEIESVTKKNMKFWTNWFEENNNSGEKTDGSKKTSKKV